MVSGPEFGWVFPSTGDDSWLGHALPRTTPGRQLLTKFGRTIDDLSYDFLLVTTGQRNNHFGSKAPYIDSLAAGAALSVITRRIRLLIAVRPGLVPAPLCARACATIDQLSEGRFMLNLVSGGRPLREFGERLEHADRYKLGVEFVNAVLGLWSGQPFCYEGCFISMDAATCYPLPWRDRRPEIFTSGTSDEAIQLAADYADVALIPGTVPTEAAKYVRLLKNAVAGRRRKVRIGTHFYVIARSSEAKAKAAAERLLSRADPAHVLPGADSSKSPMIELARHLWDGMKRLSPRPTPMIIGSYGQVVDTIKRFSDIGLSCFIMHGYPSSTEARRIDENVIPQLR
jgi:alkanesulfonate monooxygenase